MRTEGEFCPDTERAWGCGGEEAQAVVHDDQVGVNHASINDDLFKQAIEVITLRGEH